MDFAPADERLPLNEEFGDAIGADGYCRDAAIAAETATRLVTERRAAA